MSKRGEYNVQDLYNLFFNDFFPQFEQKYPNGTSRIVNNDDNRFETFIGSKSSDYVDWDEFQIHSFEKLLHLMKINEKVRSEGYEGITTLKKEYQYCMRNLRGIKILTKSNQTGIKFFSCVPKNRIDISEGEVQKMKNFLEKNISEKYFKKFAWNIESGKHPNKPNLHFHLLGDYNPNGQKNFRSRVLNDNWNKLYPNNPLEWKQGNRIGIDRKDCNNEEMIKDKLLYFHNESKGTHMNFVDLEIYVECGDWSKYRGG